MYETDISERCQMDRASFKRVTSHLKDDQIADSIEMDMMEQELDVCKW